MVEWQLSDAFGLLASVSAEYSPQIIDQALRKYTAERTFGWRLP